MMMRWRTAECDDAEENGRGRDERRGQHHGQHHADNNTTIRPAGVHDQRTRMAPSMLLSTSDRSGALRIAARCDTGRLQWSASSVQMRHDGGLHAQGRLRKGGFDGAPRAARCEARQTCRGRARRIGRENQARYEDSGSQSSLTRRCNQEMWVEEMYMSGDGRGEQASDMKTGNSQI